jgi:hypothetical protein
MGTKEIDNNMAPPVLSILGILTIVVLLGILVFVLGPFSSMKTLHRGFPVYVIQNTVHDVVKDVAEASCIMDPTVALLRVTEASATLETMIRLLGGTSVVSTICKIDTEHLQNTIRRQELQIQQSLATIQNVS